MKKVQGESLLGKDRSATPAALVLKNRVRVSLFLLILSSGFPGWQLNAQSYIVAYPQEPQAELSENYTVFLNEIPVSVYNVGSQRDVAYVHFAFAGKVTVRIHVSAEVSTYNLSPHSYDIEATRSGNDIIFELDRPRKLLLKDVNSLDEHLCIFADPLEEDVPDTSDPFVTNIMDHGADNTGVRNNLFKIQSALDALPAGGILYFPPGLYGMGGDLMMKSDRSIYLAAGAILRATKTAELRIVFTGADNARLFGRGAIDGRGDEFRPAYEGEGGKTLIYANGGSDHCLIDGIILKNAVTWTAIVMRTTNWTVHNMKVVNGRKFTNHDSWDPHSAVNMMMDDLFLYGTDDAIAYSIIDDNLDLNSTIRNSVFYNGHYGATIRIGPWVGDNTKNIRVENNDHISAGVNEYALAFYLGGSISGLKYLNNRIEEAPHGMILMRTNWEDYYAGTQSGSIQDVVFDRLSVEKAGLGWEGHRNCFEGKFPDNFVKEITFKDFYQEGVLQTSKESADLLITGSYVSEIHFTTSTTPVVDITATHLVSYREGADPGIFTVSRHGASTEGSLLVKYLVQGTSENGTDYSFIQDSVIIPAGSESADILITPDPGNTPDYFKTVLISLESGVNQPYMLGPGYHASVTISNGSESDIDTEPPSTPVNLDSSHVTPSGFLLTWDPSEDKTGIATYQVFNDGIPLASTSDTLLWITGLSASTEYEFTVKAWDRLGNASQLSEALRLTTISTGISESKLNTSFVYQNPVRDRCLFLNFEDAVLPENVLIQIFNLDGRLEYETIIQSANRMSVTLPGRLRNGLYIISINADIFNVTEKIMIT